MAHDRIVRDPKIMMGKPCIKGTRMRVGDVISLLAAGASRAEILEDYPYVTDEDITAALDYAAREMDHAILSSAEP